MTPGPVTYTPEVLAILGRQTIRHSNPVFLAEFATLLHHLRVIFGASPQDQPFVLSGSGTLGYDFIGANLLDGGRPRCVLLINTGKFGDRWAEYMRAIGNTFDSFHLISSVISLSTYLSIQAWS